MDFASFAKQAELVAKAWRMFANALAKVCQSELAKICQERGLRILLMARSSVRSFVPGS
jgi:hypothetical protein